MQLVLSNNRVLAHGENLIPMGGTVVNTETGKVYQNATVINYEGDLPCDIDKTGYEYHSGTFTPCAPYGVGTGNIAVVCNDDCKAIKDSGQSMQYLGRVAEITYTGSGGYGSNHTNSVTVDFTPVYAIITSVNPSGSATISSFETLYMGTLGKLVGVAFCPNSDEDPTATIYQLKTTFSDNSIEWYSTSSDKAQGNTSGQTYTITVFGN